MQQASKRLALPKPLSRKDLKMRSLASTMFLFLAIGVGTVLAQTSTPVWS
jgi:hypothetical protein